MAVILPAILGWYQGSIAVVAKSGYWGSRNAGDSYLRGILIHGARSVAYRVQKLPDERCNGLQRWLKGVITRSGLNKAAVALANKNARIA